MISKNKSKRSGSRVRFDYCFGLFLCTYVTWEGGSKLKLILVLDLIDYGRNFLAAYLVISQIAFFFGGFTRLCRTVGHTSKLTILRIGQFVSPAVGWDADDQFVGAGSFLQIKLHGGVDVEVFIGIEIVRITAGSKRCVVVDERLKGRMIIVAEDVHEIQISVFFGRGGGEDFMD